MKRIMFVCHGNICRSPMAEFVFKEIVAQNGMSDCFDICSRATSREEIWGNRGNPVYPPAAAELARHGLSCDGKYAQQVVERARAYVDAALGHGGHPVQDQAGLGSRPVVALIHDHHAIAIQLI